MEALGLLYSCLFQFLLHFTSLFIKSIQFFKCIIQNSWQFFYFSQNLKFFKIPQWNLIFSCKFKLSPLCMNEEKWKKCWVVYVCYRFILEQCETAAEFHHVGWVPQGFLTTTWWLSEDSSVASILFKQLRAIKIKPLLHKIFKVVQQFNQNHIYHFWVLLEKSTISIVI